MSLNAFVAKSGALEFKQKKQKKSLLAALFGCIRGPSTGEGPSLLQEAGPGEDAAGWMLKLGGKGNMQLWQRRIFVLKGTELFYYKDRADTEPKGVIRLCGASFYFVKSTDKENHFRIKHPDFKIRDLACDDERWLDTWTTCIQETIDKAAKQKEMAGWIYKKDKGGKHGWKKRYAVVDGSGILRYFENPDDLVCKGELNLKDSTFETIGDERDSLKQARRSRSSSSGTGGKFLFNIIMANQVRQFYTEGFSDRQKWKACVDTMGALRRQSLLGESDIVEKGWIMKKGGGSSLLGRKNWKKRYLVLTKDRELYWFASQVYDQLFIPSMRDTARSQALGFIELHASSTSFRVEGGYASKYNHSFKIEGGACKCGFEARAETHVGMLEWLKKIETAIKEMEEASKSPNPKTSDPANSNMV
ncbi:hypothetical protein TL16_g03272 [Triparma laevis f. inornata]|uniref:PH domain-containing protein n=1 Tax=Triparma laevis f. inornata TaxID=1714386 RepID=A0A9W7A245_9STRA|nr:hypothetical protein TL16_g03272 [Triparma laevis f. inornata]